MEKYKILITNDDGINSPALKIMGKELSKLGEVYIIVPERERSGGSHAITLHKPLRVNEVKWPLKKVKVWSTNGNPADCVLLGLYAILSQKPDLVISGINKGYNLGNDIIYSGTVSGAREASLNGIPAVSISVSQDGEEEDFKKATELLIRLFGKFLKIIPEGTFLNINVPPNAKVDEICFTYQGKFHYRNIVERRLDPRNKEYFWLHGYIEEIGEEGSDIWAVKNGKISITPLQSDMTNYSLLNLLKADELF
ncbi:5'/3'-nucleotidase SurE [Dictyoglomus thermophilum]|uniref:5'-nucleotidase SurE n=1 Tax=Dictyoglomus thermophilum (strain ATCC 35947 / DSM 3960 / H-6-12) TaxID=309799 RepID=B5YE72_DICT6|nr:5'/3'-nucleotidase SurE [Dictyoglomus thermophilum]ACI19841.1 5'/3'-nucleotidase SurE [Dictyoglomus thermophilum H-6-12]